MSKENLLKEFDERFCESKYYITLKQFLSQAIDQTREETIRDIRKHDEEELIKMFSNSPYKYIEIQQLIKYYYGK